MSGYCGKWASWREKVVLLPTLILGSVGPGCAGAIHMTPPTGRGVS